MKLHLRFVACWVSEQPFLGQMMSGLLSPNPFEINRFLSIPFLTRYSSVAEALRLERRKL